MTRVPAAISLGKYARAVKHAELPIREACV